MAVGEEREQAGLERTALADHRLLDLVEDPLGVLGDLIDRKFAHGPILSISSTSAEISSIRVPPRAGHVGASQSGRTTTQRLAGIRSSARSSETP